LKRWNRLAARLFEKENEDKFLKITVLMQPCCN